MDEVRVDGVRLAYRAAGDPQAPPAVLLHALGEDATTWQTVCAVLAIDRRLYALDLRGHGRSEWPGAYSLERMRDDVLGLLDALGLARVTLIGHSLGAVVGYLVAQRRPEVVDRLVLEDPLPPLPADPPRPLPARPAGTIGFDWAVVAAVNPQRNAPDPAWWDGLARITAPTLIVAGGPDSHLPQDRIGGTAAMIPDCRLVTIPAGHLVHENRPMQFLAALAAFFGGHDDGPHQLVVHLQMTGPDQLRPSRDDPSVELVPAKPGDPLVRSLVEEIGAPHAWPSGAYSEQMWRAWLADTRRRQWLVHRGGQVAGLVEMEIQPGGTVEIATFGLLPRYVARGIGGPALTQAVRLAWAQDVTTWGVDPTDWGLDPAMTTTVRRVWLHTASTDHRNALPNYLRRGFRPFRTELLRHR